RTRPRGSRLGAWISHQSQVIAGRQQLDERVPELERRYPGDDVPLPPYWGGFRLRPDSIEFWQGRASRLHDRIRYVRDGDRWRIERLSP
ncbi:MAG TPA: pyridoxine 5'-phosphate oxidase C-terminal domain-containing protein, partial [Gemmatimonadales bacterium]|nr:pyridoxine 5'-phosphate oxidase C-terminal domain-containing protein [Gemmatimonadales bacterium]